MGVLKRTRIPDTEVKGKTVQLLSLMNRAREYATLSTSVADGNCTIVCELKRLDTSLLSYHNGH